MTTVDTPSLEMLDPVATLGPLCTHLIFGQLDPYLLARCCLVCKEWQAVCGDQAFWRRHTEELWRDKVYVPDSIQSQPDRKKAFSLSVQDAQRDTLTDAELCAVSWRFSFKEAFSRSHFAEAVASFNVVRYFNANHTVTAPEDDPLWGNDYPRHFWFFRPGFLGRQAIQVNSYPFLTVRRCQDWGWLLENDMVKLDSDFKSGPNPGLAPDHPAAREDVTPEHLARMFAGIGPDFDEEDFDPDVEYQVLLPGDQGYAAEDAGNEVEIQPLLDTDADM